MKGTYSFQPLRQKRDAVEGWLVALVVGVSMGALFALPFVVCGVP